MSRPTFYAFTIGLVLGFMAGVVLRELFGAWRRRMASRSGLCDECGGFFLPDKAHPGICCDCFDRLGGVVVHGVGKIGAR